MRDGLLILLIITGIIIVGILTLIYAPEAKGQVFLNEDEALICIKDVWSNISNSVVCKVYPQDGIDKLGMHSIYAEMMQESDTFGLEIK